MNITIFLPNWIGDCVMATPALRALRRHYGPRARMVGVMKPYVQGVLAGTKWLNDAFFYDYRAKDPQLQSPALIERIRDFDCDVAILLTNSLRSAYIAWQGGAKERVGFAENGRGLLLSRHSRGLKLPRRGWKKIPHPAVDSYLDLAYAAGCDWESRQLELATEPADELAADQIWNDLRLPSPERVVVMHAGGGWGGTASAKAWPQEYFAELARRMVDQLQLGVLILCGPNEREEAAAIATAAGRPQVVSLAKQKLSLGLSKACVRRSRLMVTTDSGPRHFAAAFKVPVVSLFGPTDPRWTITYHAGETRLFHAVDCGPCAKKTCPLGHHACMRELTVDRVFAASVRRLEEEKPQRKAA